MIDVKNASNPSSNFNLKHETVQLLPVESTSAQAKLSVSDLEGMRVSRQPVPASKHSLELICGASCETGAQ